MDWVLHLCDRHEVAQVGKTCWICNRLCETIYIISVDSVSNPSSLSDITETPTVQQRAPVET